MISTFERKPCSNINLTGLIQKVGMTYRGLGKLWPDLGIYYIFYIFLMTKGCVVDVPNGVEKPIPSSHGPVSSLSSEFQGACTIINLKDWHNPTLYIHYPYIVQVFLLDSNSELKLRIQTKKDIMSRLVWERDIYVITTISQPKPTNTSSKVWKNAVFMKWLLIWTWHEINAPIKIIKTSSHCFLLFPSTQIYNTRPKS